MKKVIDGKIYDTEKAVIIGKKSFGGYGDFRYLRVELCKTKKSNIYFLAGEGGPMTEYAHQCIDGSFSGGRGIRVLTKAEALSWAEENLSTEQIEAEFGDDIQDA